MSTCALSCGHAPSPHSQHTTGTAHTRDGREICWDCASKEELDSMIEDGKNYMYLSRDGNAWKVANWTGRNEFYVARVKTGSHNICGYRFDFWFIGPDKHIWHGVQYSDGHSRKPIDGYTCTVNRTKQRTDR